MASSTLDRQHDVVLLPAITKLALWRFKQMWRFLLTTWLGMLAMVVLVCALPLFSRVAISADLRSTVASSPDGQNISIQVGSTHPTQAQIDLVTQQLDQILRQGSLSAYLQAAPSFSVTTPTLSVVQGRGTAQAGLILQGYDLTQAATHVTLVHGQLPQATSDGSVEIALTQDVASALHLQVGSTFQVHYPSTAGSLVWDMRVSGIIAPARTGDPFWSAGSPFGTEGVNSGPTVYSSLVSLDAIKAKIAAIQITPDITNPKSGIRDSFRLNWSYPFDLAHLDANSTATISQAVANLNAQLENTIPQQVQNITFAFPVGSLVQALESYARDLVVLEVVVTLLLLITLAIVLFLVSMLSDMLVDRQSAVIAILRSRGATRRHIFGAFVMQGFVLGLAALLAGPLLAILLVRGIAQFLLTPANQSALSVITSNPLQAALDVKWYAIIAVAVALFVMILAIHRASKLDIVTLRRKSSRTKRVPFWRRLNLDILLVLLIVVGYAGYVYSWQILAATQQLTPIAYNLLQALGFIAPELVVAAALMLFLRLLPLILRVATYLAAKMRSASAMLAFAQMERSPRPAARIIILLALALASSGFLFTLITTKEARVIASENYAVGADFSGALPGTDATKTFSQLKTEYSTMSGVLSATIGYEHDVQPSGGLLTSNGGASIQLDALDADTLAQTAIWPSQNGNQSLSELTAQLRAHRNDATAHNVVYAVVDAALWQQYHLSVGQSFTLPMDDAGDLQIRFVALAEVNHLPGVYDTTLNNMTGVGLLVDYQSYATVYKKDSGTALTPNEVLLSTKSDATAHIRQTLPALQDRRQLITNARENNIHLDIIGVLAIAVGAALILALVGTLLSSWLNASSRRTNFAVVRALGMVPRQIAAVLLWEQGFVYILALLFGIGLGALLIIFTAPIVSLLTLAGPDARQNLYAIPPVQTVVPYLQLAYILVGVVLVCLVALVLMARIVSRPSIGQTLRLNED